MSVSKKARRSCFSTIHLRPTPKVERQAQGSVCKLAPYTRACYLRRQRPLSNSTSRPASVRLSSATRLLSLQNLSESRSGTVWPCHHSPSTPQPSVWSGKLGPGGRKGEGGCVLATKSQPDLSSLCQYSKFPDSFRRSRSISLPNKDRLRRRLGFFSASDLGWLVACTIRTSARCRAESPQTAYNCTLLVGDSSVCNVDAERCKPWGRQRGKVTQLG